jgi:hypothetical protein
MTKRCTIVIGICCSAVMFFISGTLIGYSIKNENVQILENKPKERRRVCCSLLNTLNTSSLIQAPISKFRMHLSKVRSPNLNAIAAANSYKSNQ